MALTKLSDIINPQVMGDMIQAKIPAMLKYTPYAKIDTTLVGVPGDTKTVPSWNFIGSAEDVAEGDSITPSKMTASTTTFTIKKAMKSVGITQEAVNSGLGDPIGQAEIQLAKSIAVKIENDVREVLYKGSLSYDGTTSKIGYNSIVDAIDVLEEEENTTKVVFVHPKQVTDLRKDSNFIDANKYVGMNVMVSGEIGTIANCRVVPSKNVPKIEYTLATSTTQNAVLVVESGASTGEVNLSTVKDKCVWDATNKAVVFPKVGDYISAVANPYYLNPIVKLEPASAETEYTEDELPAVTIFLKKDIQVDAEWLPKSQQYDITVAKYYGVALTNASKVVLAKFKA